MSTDVLYKGSVKDILATTESAEHLLFHFSDRYSIFDWGEMPDLLAGKGEALSVMAYMLYKALGNALSWKHWNLPEHMRESFNMISMFEKFKHVGVPHHMIGFSDPLGKTLGDQETSSYLKVKKVHVERPLFKSGKYDYSAYKKQFTSTLVPLEIIFRFGAPQGSSVFKRAADEKYRGEVGLKSVPKPGVMFDRPIIEFFTKLETTDRYLTYQGARDVAGLSTGELERLISFTTLIAYRLKEYFYEAGLTLWDGKIEVAYSDKHDSGRHFMLVDSVGPDELRLDFEGVPMSKELLRSFYRNSDWYSALEAAKTLAKSRGEKNWKSLVGSDQTPAPLTDVQRELATALYPTLARSLKRALKMDVDYDSSKALELDELAKKMKEVIDG